MNFLRSRFFVNKLSGTSSWAGQHVGYQYWYHYTWDSPVGPMDIPDNAEYANETESWSDLDGETEEIFRTGYMLDDESNLDNFAESLMDSLVRKNWGLDGQVWYRKYRRKKRYPMKDCTHLTKGYKRKAGEFHFSTGPFQTARCVGTSGGPMYVPKYLYKNFPYGCKFHLRIQDIVSEVKLHELTVGNSTGAVFLNDWAFYNNTSCWKDVRSVALGNMLPDLEDGFSLPVFIAELKDLRGMVGGVLALLGKLPTVLRKSFNQPLKQMSKSQLSVSFGWIPFVSDSRRLIERLMNLRKDVQKFIEDADKRKTYHYTIRLSGTDFKPEAYFETQNLADIEIEPMYAGYPCNNLAGIITSIGIEHKMTPSLGNIFYNASVDYSYSLKDISGWGPFLAGMDRLGINLSLSDVWEIIPFSFVVDWFYRVQTLAERFDLTNLPPQLHIYDFCDSLKYDYAELHSLEVKWVTASPWLGVPFGSQTWGIPGPALHRYSESAYYRRAGMPPVTQADFPNLTLPNGMQIILGGALIGSRT